MIRRIAYCLILFSLFSCTSAEQKDYDHALRWDSVSAWERYISKHQRSENSGQAKERLAKLNQIQQEKEEAKDKAAWQTAESEDSLHSYAKYLHTRPEGMSAADAKAILRSRIEQRIERITGGDPRQIRPGSELSMEPFKVIEILDAMGAKNVRHFIRSTGGLRKYRLFYPMDSLAGASISKRLVILRNSEATFGLTLSGTERGPLTGYDQNSMGYALIKKSKFHRTKADEKSFKGAARVIVTHDGTEAVYEFK